MNKNGEDLRSRVFLKLLVLNLFTTLNKKNESPNLIRKLNLKLFLKSRFDVNKYNC